MVDDPVYAAQMVEQHPERGQQAPPDWLSWTVEAEGLARLADLLSQLVADKDPKHRKARTTRRPVTAIDRAYDAAEDRQDDAFETDVLSALGVGSVV